MEERDIVHRDLKTQNIVFKYTDGSYDLALVDFGFAINYKKLQERPKIFGTAGYFAPEILKLEAFDCRADIYSLGVVMFQM